MQSSLKLGLLQADTQEQPTKTKLNTKAKLQKMFQNAFRQYQVKFQDYYHHNNYAYNLKHNRPYKSQSQLPQLLKNQYLTNQAKIFALLTIQNENLQGNRLTCFASTLGPEKILLNPSTIKPILIKPLFHKFLSIHNPKLKYRLSENTSKKFLQ